MHMACCPCILERAGSGGFEVKCVEEYAEAVVLEVIEVR